MASQSAPTAPLLGGDSMNTSAGRCVPGFAAASPDLRQVYYQHTLLQLLRSEAWLQRQLIAQSDALRRISAASASLVVAWRVRPTKEGHPLIYFRSLHELLMDTELEADAHDRRAGLYDSRVAAQAVRLDMAASRNLNESKEEQRQNVVLNCIRRRIVDPEGLPPSHPLLFGSLQPTSFARLLPHLLHWMRLVASEISRYSLCLRHDVPGRCRSSECAMIADKGVSAGSERTATATALTYITPFHVHCRVVERLLHFILLASSTTTREEPRPVSSVTMDGDEHTPSEIVGVLRHHWMWPRLRLLLVDVAEVRDALLEEAISRRATGLWLVPPQPCSGDTVASLACTGPSDSEKRATPLETADDTWAHIMAATAESTSSPGWYVHGLPSACQEGHPPGETSLHTTCHKHWLSVEQLVRLSELAAGVATQLQQSVPQL